MSISIVRTLDQEIEQDSGTQDWEKPRLETTPTLDEQFPAQRPELWALRRAKGFMLVGITERISSQLGLATMTPPLLARPFVRRCRIQGMQRHHVRSLAGSLRKECFSLARNVV
jgi:hypothetical protein